MFKFTVLLSFVLTIISCPNESIENAYQASCNSIDGTSHDFTFLITDSQVVLFKDKGDPNLWSLNLDDGNERTEVSYQGILIDFSNKDSIVGKTFKETTILDTLVVFDPKTNKESIVIVESQDSQLVNTCSFIKKND